MSTNFELIPPRILGAVKRLCPVKKSILNIKIKNLSDFVATVSSTTQSNDTYWFRGHSNIKWSLCPTALRYKSSDKRKKALSLFNEFKRIAEIKLKNPPSSEDHLKWLQIAQHNGIPTRLLDWTESPIFALFFACVMEKNKNEETTGAVYLINPSQLRNVKGKTNLGPFEESIKNDTINKYVDLDPYIHKRGLKTISITPSWNSERIMMQRGVFTLHGSQKFNLENNQVSSLVCIPILKEYKTILRKELDKIGVDEITLFPELEYSSLSLKRKRDLL